MTPANEQSFKKFPLVASLVLFGAVAAGLLFAGWANYSDTIFTTMLMDGISWCF